MPLSTLVEENGRSTRFFVLCKIHESGRFIWPVCFHTQHWLLIPGLTRQNPELFDGVVFENYYEFQILVTTDGFELRASFTKCSYLAHESINIVTDRTVFRTVLDDLPRHTYFCLEVSFFPENDFFFPESVKSRKKGKHLHLLSDMHLFMEWLIHKSS